MDKIEEILTRGIEKIYPSKEALEKVLRSGKKIRLYNGIDPSGPKLHLGHLVVLQKLRQFQELGHQVILLIGDFTGMIGDPTDKKAVRKKLTRKEVLQNAKNYKEQAEKILSFDGGNPVEIKFNSQWLGKLTMEQFFDLSSKFTVSQIWGRDMFQERIKNGKEVWIHEFLYPLLQAYDSLALEVDLEVGGNDQTFNMLCGRTLMKSAQGKEKFVITMRLLAEPGETKMGKTENNLVAINENPQEMFAKIMNFSDGLIIPGFNLLTDIDLEKISSIKESLKDSPMEFKKQLAYEIVKKLHSEKEAKESQENFEKVFQKRELPGENSPTPSYEISAEEAKNFNPIKTLVGSATVGTASEAKRLINQGGVDIDGLRINDYTSPIEIKDNSIIKVGKRKFLKIKIKE